MAVWTRRLGVFTIILAIIAGITAAILFRTDETARTANRAFVVADTLEIFPVLDKQGVPSHWMVSPMLQNSGNTSTRRMHFFPGFIRDELTVAQFITRLDPDKTEIEFGGARGFPASLGPKSKIAQTTYVVDADDAKSLREGKVAIYILGMAIYGDIFNEGEDRKTKFCFKLFGSTGNTGISSVYGMNVVKLKEVDGLSARMCRYNNCVDEECGPQGYHYEKSQ